MIFSDGFETDLSEWKTKTTTPSNYYKLQRTTTKARSGDYSVEVYQTKDKGDTALYKTFATQSTGTVIFWFYDDTTVTGKQVVGIKNGEKKFWIGIKGGTNSPYVWRIGSFWHTTTIQRSTGWHKIMFVSTGKYTRGLIDDEIIWSTPAIHWEDPE